MTKYANEISEWLVDTLSGHKTRENYFKKYQPVWYDDMQNFNIENNLNIKNFHQLLYHYLNDIKIIPTCENKRTLKFWNWHGGYSKYCENHRECDICNKKHQEDIHNKVKEKYGVDNVSQVKEVNEKRKNTLVERYGVDCVWKSKEINDKKKQTVKERYGVDNVGQLDWVIEKCKNTNLKKYGVESYSKTDEFKEKHKQTVLEHYGVEHQWQSKEIKEKSKQTCLQKYGKENVGQVKEFKDKAKQTNIERYGSESYLSSDNFKKMCIERYGEEHMMKNVSVFDNNMQKCFKKKEVIFPSGKIEKVQGYEANVILHLLNDGIKEEQFIIDNKQIEDAVGKIFYNKHRYYPDFLIKENESYTIFEVKSSYTYNTALKDNILYNKMKACKNLGYKFEIIVADKNGNYIKRIKNLEDIK